MVLADLYAGPQKQHVSGATATAMAIVAFVGSLGTVDAQSSITYTMTIRDFMPSGCLQESEYLSAWGSGNTFGGIQDDWFSTYTDVADLESDTSESSQFWIPYPYGTSWSMVGNYCPYWDSLRVGDIKGHPDFEVYGGFNTYVNGPSCVRGTIDSCESINATVKNNTITATSGLPKVQYCSDDGSRCGCSSSGRCTMSNGTNFKSWYNDDSTYNKRVGLKLQLDYQSSSGEYVFDAASSSASSSVTNTYSPYFIPLKKFNTLTQDDYTKAESPAWPHSYIDFPSSNSVTSNKFWFTTEIHTYFQYNGGESFEFDGDDDVWVFIDNKLAVDLGGLHPSRSGSVDLDSFAAEFGLELNQTYSFSLFHAERHTDESNFKMSTTLATTCNVVKSGSSSFSWTTQDISSDWFLSSDATWDTTDSSPVLNLITSETPKSTPVSAYLQQQQNVGAGFVIDLDVQLSSIGRSEGFAIVLHDRPDGLDNMPVTTGAGLNYRFLTNAVAIVFDLCEDRDTGTCSEQSVTVHYANSTDGLIGYKEGSAHVTDRIMRSLSISGENHTIRVEYFATPNWLQVYIDDSLYLRQENFTVQDILGGRNAYVGITSATSQDTPSPLSLLNLTITTVSVDSSATEAVDFQDGEMLDEPVLVPADGSSLGGLAVQYRDLCEYSVSYGGEGSLLSALFVERLEDDGSTNTTGRLLRRTLDSSVTTYYGGALEPAVINGTIVDNRDGTYTASLATTIQATFDMYVCTGEGCTFQVDYEQIDSVNSNVTLLNATVTTLNYEWAASAQGAVRMIPVTARPTPSPDTYTGTTNNNRDKIIKASAGGAAAFVAFSLCAFIMLWYRRKWLRDKAYIENGRLYNLERQTQYDPNSEYTMTSHAMMASKAAVERERARATPYDGTKSIQSLRKEHADLQEQLRLEKLKQQEGQSRTTSRFSTMFGVNRHNRRKQFEEGDHLSL